MKWWNRKRELKRVKQEQTNAGEKTEAVSLMGLPLIPVPLC